MCLPVKYWYCQKNEYYYYTILKIVKVYNHHSFIRPRVNTQRLTNRTFNRDCLHGSRVKVLIVKSACKDTFNSYCLVIEDDYLDINKNYHTDQMRSYKE